MHRNTFLLVLFLGIFAALVVGVNIGKKMNSGSENKSSVLNTAVASPKSTPIPKMLKYSNTTCGFALTYPDTFTLEEDASGSAALQNTKSDSTILMTCQKDIPRPPLPDNLIESIVLSYESKAATLAAKLYHDKTAKDGSPLDSLIYYNPKLRTDIFIAGYGEEFTSILKTIRILP